MLETKWVVSGSAFLTLVIRRDAATCIFLIGAILNAVLGKILKALFRVKRPAGSVLRDPGFPSSHAMSLFFFAAYLSLMVPEVLLPATARWATVALHAAAAAASLARVRGGLHTYRQVLGGAAFGWIDGRGWHRAAYGVGGGGGAVGVDGGLIAHAERWRQYAVAACVVVCVVGGFVVSGRDRKLRAQLAFGGDDGGAHSTMHSTNGVKEKEGAKLD